MRKEGKSSGSMRAISVLSFMHLAFSGQGKKGRGKGHAGCHPVGSDSGAPDRKGKREGGMRMDVTPRVLLTFTGSGEVAVKDQRPAREG